MEALGKEQLSFAKQQYGEMKPLLERVAQAQMDAQQQQMQQAKDYYDYQVGTFRPVEQGLVADAQKFSTEGYREQLARDAAAATGRAFGVAQEQPVVSIRTLVQHRLFSSREFSALQRSVPTQ
jgi:hypothetical protein